MFDSGAGNVMYLPVQVKDDIALQGTATSVGFFWEWYVQEVDSAFYPDHLDTLRNTCLNSQYSSPVDTVVLALNWPRQGR